jgi:phage anti-repressor protein
MDFKTFIIKYSFVNSKFVEDFYNIIKEDYIERYNEFLIDSEILRIWLQINNRRIFNDTIKRSYRKNIDYTITTKKKSVGSGGQNFEVITLTPESAKKICLSTKSKIGHEVQQYFIDLELALYKYKNYIIDGMNKKIAQLENNQKPKINPAKKIIYIFRALNTDTTLYKVGRTYSSKTRFFNHNSPAANDIEVIFHYETEDLTQVEMCIKAKMKKAQYRKFKEIYEVDLDIIKGIIKDCDDEIKKTNKKIESSNKKQKGGKITPLINETTKFFMFIPNLKKKNMDDKKSSIKSSKKSSKKTSKKSSKKTSK